MSKVKQARIVGIMIGCLMVTSLTQAALVGYWDFETVGSGTTPDQSGLGYDLNVMGGAALVSDTPASITGSNSMNFNGTDAYLYQFTSSTPDLKISGSLTMSVWRKAAIGGAASQEVISAAHSDYRWRLSSVVAGNANGSEQLYIESGQAVNYWGNLNQVWNHFAMVWDEENQEGRLYKNGTLVQTQSLAANLTTTASRFSIGAYYNGTFGDFFKGQMDDVAIYDQVLTGSEITSLADGSKTPITVIPEPATLGLISSAGLALLMLRRIRM